MQTKGFVRRNVVEPILVVIIAFALGGAGSSLVVSSAGAEPAVFTVYMDPAGSDTNDGMTPGSAVKTLDRVQDILKAENPTTNVEVRIKQGVYVAPTTAWNFYIPGQSIRFWPIDYEPGMGFNDINGRPVFRSDGGPDYWFRAYLAPGDTGGSKKLDFRYLHVERYAKGGLLFNGGVTTNSEGIVVPADEGVNDNFVYGMKFYQLGRTWNSEHVGYGGIVTWNSSDNKFRNNIFENLENPTAERHLIHGIYLRHHSNRNIATGSAYRHVSGNPFHLGNDSNDNDVYNNTFTRSGTSSFYDEWFCDVLNDCPNLDTARECASHGNWFRGNTVLSGYFGETDLQLFQLNPSGIQYAGGSGCDNEGEPRLSTKNNVRS